MKCPHCNSVISSRHVFQRLEAEIASLRKDAAQMWAALEQSGSSNRLPDELIKRWDGK